MRVKQTLARGMGEAAPPRLIAVDHAGIRREPR